MIGSPNSGEFAPDSLGHVTEDVLVETGRRFAQMRLEGRLSQPTFGY